MTPWVGVASFPVPIWGLGMRLELRLELRHTQAHPNMPHSQANSNLTFLLLFGPEIEATP